MGYSYDIKMHTKPELKWLLSWVKERKGNLYHLGKSLSLENLPMVPPEGGRLPYAWHPEDTSRCREHSLAVQPREPHQSPGISGRTGVDRIQ